MARSFSLFIYLIVSSICVAQQTPAPAAQNQTAPPQRSLADVARDLKSKQTVQIKVNANDAKALFASVDEVMDFASQDTGLPRRIPVKRQLVGQDDVRRHMSEALADSEEARNMARTEVVLKKFGYLPSNFDLKSFLVTSSGQSIAGFYDLKNKTMNLLNWIELEQQRPIMAHELTHALQDQNYDLLKWEGGVRHDSRPPSMRVSNDDSEESSARRAVVEGQAMVVFYDYLLKPHGTSLAENPAAIEFVKDRMIQTYDTSLVVHNAPLLLKDTAMFPYREGLMFELELLKHGGPDQAFAGAFTHPPADTHEILNPKSFLAGEKSFKVSIPDLTPILGTKYQAYDSGTMGELDARIMAQQFGTENDMFSIAPNWRGGAYVAVKRASADVHNEATTSTADIALIYVSRWKTDEAAERFVEIYKKSLTKRVTVMDEKQISGPNCSGGSCIRVDSSEGPIFLEIWPGNTVLIAHSFDEATVVQLRRAVLTHVAAAQNSNPQPELSLRLLSMPAFQILQEQLGREIVASFVNSRSE